MPIVKAQQAHHLQNSAIVMDLSDLEAHARTIIQQAHAQAATILESARAKAAADSKTVGEEARRAGHDAGFKAGCDEGLIQGRQDATSKHTVAFQQLLARWQQTLGVFQENLPAHLADARSDLVKLALAISAKVTRQEGLRNPAVVKANVEAALGLVSAGRHVTLHVHPDEIAALENYTPELLATFKNISAIQVQSDPTVEPGGCITRFGAGEVDSRLETQIQRIADELLATDA